MAMETVEVFSVVTSCRLAATLQRPVMTDERLHRCTKGDEPGEGTCTDPMSGPSFLLDEVFWLTGAFTPIM
jgi:hypothetical protein